MTMTQIAERKALYRKIRGLSDKTVVQVMGFIDSIAVDDILQLQKGGGVSSPA